MRRRPGNYSPSTLDALRAPLPGAVAVLRDARSDLQRIDRQLRGAVRRLRLATTDERRQRAAHEVCRARSSWIATVMRMLDQLCRERGLDADHRRRLLAHCYADQLRPRGLGLKLDDRALLVAENFIDGDAAIAEVLGCKRGAVANRRDRLPDDWGEQVANERQARAAAGEPAPADVRGYYLRTMDTAIRKRAALTKMSTNESTPLITFWTRPRW